MIRGNIETVNNIKKLTNFNDISRFIDGIGHTSKIQDYPGGNEFIQNFCDSIRDWRETHVNGFEYVTDNDNISYFLLVVRPHSDERLTEVISTHHLLSKSSFNYNDSSEVTIEANQASTWLKQRACHELHLPNQILNKLMYKPTDYPTIDSPKCHIYPGVTEKNVTAQEVKRIIQQSNPTGLFPGWRYILVNKAKNEITFLESMPEILEYRQHCHQPEQFYEDLAKEIQSLKNYKQKSYLFLHGKKLCALIIIMQAIDGNVIEIACRFETVVESSS